MEETVAPLFAAGITSDKKGELYEIEFIAPAKVRAICEVEWNIYHSD